MSLLRCSQCLNEYPAKQFRSIKDQVCDACWTGRSAARAEKALETRAKDVAKALASLSPDQVKAGIGSVGDIIGTIYDQFGGPSGFATEFHNVLTKLCDDPKPSVAAIFVSIMKLHHVVESSQKELSLKEMSLEQLQRESEMAALQYITEAMADPAKAATLEQLLMRHGVTVVPADPAKVIDAVATKAEALLNEPAIDTMSQDGRYATNACPTEEEIQAFMRRGR